AGEAWVGRLILLYEPRRSPAVGTLPVTTGEKPFESRSRLGIGFDYVFTRHLKIYTEQYFTRTTSFPRQGDPDDGGAGDDTGDFDDDLDDGAGDEADGAYEARVDDRNPKADYVAAA